MIFTRPIFDVKNIAVLKYIIIHWQFFLSISIHITVLTEIMIDSFEKDSDLPPCWHSCGSNRLLALALLDSFIYNFKIIGF